MVQQLYQLRPEFHSKIHSFYSPDFGFFLITILDCLNNLKTLARICKLTLIWVPGHEGIDGNLKADELTRKGSETRFILPEPFCGYGLSNFKLRLQEWEEEAKKQHFEGLSTNSHSRRFIEYSAKRTEEVLQLSKKELKILTDLMTGHCGMWSHLFRIGKIQESSCRLCLEEEETAEHILCECERNQLR